MSNTSTARLLTGNAFLDALPDEAAAMLFPLLSMTEMPYKMQIARTGEPIQRISFPKSGVISAVTRMLDGTEIEVTLIGREGFHGLQAILGDGTSTSPAMVQLAGRGYTIPTHQFLDAVAADRELGARVLRYAQSGLETIAQFAGCNRLHELEQRCARWLLMVHDRVGNDDMPLTHEYLATMLGVGRPTVTLTTGAFARAGYIKNKRGSIQILDRDGLEKLACECYGHVGAVLERLMGYRIEPKP